MAIRDVPPLDDKQWTKLQELMKRGSSERQLQFIEESKRMRNIKTRF